MNRPVVAITTGDAAGVGPEVVVEALAREEEQKAAPSIAGTGRADEASMVEALRQAADLAQDAPGSAP